MKSFIFLLLFVLIASSTATPATVKKYQPTWDSLDTRPNPPWYDEAKVGIFIHWGVFSVPSFGSEWFWWLWKGSKSPSVIDFMNKNYKPGFAYADFAPQFTAELFDPNQWADLFKAAGAKYVVLTSKHHEGFCNWQTNVSFNWNSIATGPHRDLVGDLAAAIRNRTDIHFGLYHSFFEWFHPLYLQDKASGFKTQKFVKTKTIPEMYEIVNKYRPDVVWPDGEWEASSEYWTSQEFIAWLFNDSPVKDVVAINDRWGKDARNHHGGFYTGQDRYNPGKLIGHKWENAMTLDKSSWGFRRNAVLSDYLTIEELLSELVSTVSCGGNILINVGPTKDGHINPIFEERLRQMGTWLGINGEAIYKSKPWTHQNDTVTKNVWYTSGNGAVYAIILQWPANGKIFLGAPRVNSATKMTLLGSTETVKFVGADNGVTVYLPVDTPLEWVWTVKIVNEQYSLPLMDIL